MALEINDSLGKRPHPDFCCHALRHKPVNIKNIRIFQSGLFPQPYKLHLASVLLILWLFVHTGSIIAADMSKAEMGISEYAKTAQGKELPKPGLKSQSTADHSQYEELQGPFTNGPEVTKACLKCHNKAGDQFVKNKHWTWEYKHPVTGRQLGKKTLINGFCTNARGNEGMCAQCHAGYGWKDETFDFTNQENIDCLICHDTTGAYYKTPNSKGNKACSVMFKGKKPIGLL